MNIVSPYLAAATKSLKALPFSPLLDECSRLVGTRNVSIYLARVVGEYGPRELGRAVGVGHPRIVAIVQRVEDAREHYIIDQWLTAAEELLEREKNA